jgi:hypothetical protein
MHAQIDKSGHTVVICHLTHVLHGPDDKSPARVAICHVRQVAPLSDDPRADDARASRPRGQVGR